MKAVAGFCCFLLVLCSVLGRAALGSLFLLSFLAFALSWALVLFLFLPLFF